MTFKVYMDIGYKVEVTTIIAADLADAKNVARQMTYTAPGKRVVKVEEVS